MWWAKWWAEWHGGERILSLTQLEIKHAKEGMHPDGNGLYLRVQKSGAKSWIFRYQLNGRRREMGIGTLSSTPPADARLLASQLRSKVIQKIDPIDDRKFQETLDREKAQQALAAVKCFRAVAEEYIESHRSAWKNAKHVSQWTNTLNSYAHPIIGNKPIGSITTNDILKILQPIWESKTETAGRLRARIEAVIAYAKALKLFTGDNPALWKGHLDTLLPKPTKIKKVRHHPALPPSQAPAFMAKLKQIPGNGARALEFAILTAARSGEVRAAVWSEIDFNKRLWTIPAERMKMKREHYVPLSDAAIKLLEKIPRIIDTNYIFPGERKRRPLSDMTLSAVIRNMNKSGQDNKPMWLDDKSKAPVVPHGFRSTFRDWAAEIGSYPRELAEHALAHGLPSKVEAAYHRGTMLTRREPMMQAWADFLSGKQEPNLKR